MNQQQYGMPPNQMHPQDQQQQQGNFMGQMMPHQIPQMQQQSQMQQPQMQSQMNPNYQQHYMNTPQGPESQQHMAQPSPQVYTQPSPYNQQHSVGSFNIPPGSTPSMQPHTPQQQLSIPHDGRFTSPQSITQRSPATNVMSNQPMQQHPSMSHSQPTPGAPPSIRQQTQQQQAPPQAFPTDPLQANRLLIIKELRRALHEVSQAATFLLSLKFSSEIRGPPSAPNYQALSVGNPASANPASNAPQVKEQPGPSTDEEIKTAQERYVHSVQQFLAVADNIERNYATILQANREYQRYDQLSAVKVPNDLALHPYVELIQPSLETISEDCSAVERCINEMNRLVQKVKAAENQTKNEMDTM